MHVHSLCETQVDIPLSTSSCMLQYSVTASRGLTWMFYTGIALLSGNSPNGYYCAQKLSLVLPADHGCVGQHFSCVSTALLVKSSASMYV